MLASVAEQTALALGSLTKKVTALSKAQTARCKDCQEGNGGVSEAAAGGAGVRQQQLAAVKHRAMRRVLLKRRAFH